MNEYVKNFGITENSKNLDLLSLVRTTKYFDEDTSYLPLPFKKMWFRSENPQGNVRYETLEKDNDHITVEARVYENKNDERDAYIGIGLATALKEKCGDNQFLSEVERVSLMLATARGLACSKALVDAGFGLQFYGDSFDPEREEEERLKREANENSGQQTFESIPLSTGTVETAYTTEDSMENSLGCATEESQVVDAEMPESTSPLEEKVIIPEKRRGRGRPPKKETVDAKESYVDSESQVKHVESICESGENCEQESADEIQVLTLESAKAVIIPTDYGPERFRGKTLGSVDNPNYFSWMNKNLEGLPENVVAAFKVIVANDEVIQRKIKS